MARILIVVKDSKLLELLGLQLETASHAVRSVGDPLAVPGLLQDWPADLLLSDMRSGSLPLLRASKERQSPPITRRPP